MFLRKCLLMRGLLWTAFLVLLSAHAVFALPQDGNVVGGSASIVEANSQTLQVIQESNRAIINWGQFNINTNERVQFIQPSANAAILNRVIGVDPSLILGQLTANGQVFLVNPNGILFGKNAMVDAAGLMAATFNIQNTDFMAGHDTFFQDGSKAGFVINQGTINIADNGFVFLAASGVANEGLIVARLGTVVLGAGEKLAIDFSGDGLVNFAVEGKALSQVTLLDGTPLTSAVSNSGTIAASGGHVVMTGRGSADVLSSVINQSGIIQATSLVHRGGVIELLASDSVTNTGAVGALAHLGQVQNAAGAVVNTGVLDISAAEAGAAQGKITLAGQYVGNGGIIRAQGADGAQGGNILLASTDKTIVTQSGVLDTSGLLHSSAGNIVIWSDHTTLFGGTIMARGGAVSGDGGQMEISGKEALSVSGVIGADARNGRTGSVLLDPKFITVANNGGAVLNDLNQFSDGNGVSSATIAPATINAATANVILQANTDITFTDPISIATAGVGFTAQAGRSIILNNNITTNNGAIALTANDAGAMGGNKDAGIGGISMTNGTAVVSHGADIALSVGVSSTGGNILLSSVNAGTGSVRITSPNAAILDNNGVFNNVVAHTLTLVSVAGIGSAADPLETAVTNMNVTTTGAGLGDIFITDSNRNGFGGLTVKVNNSSARIHFRDGLDSLNIDDASMTLSASAAGTALTIENTGGPLTIGTAGLASGVVTTAGGAAGALIQITATGNTNGDITINDVAATELDAGIGQVILTANGDNRILNMNAGTLIHAEGGVTLVADRMNFNPSGTESRVMAGGSRITLNSSSVNRIVDIGGADVNASTLTTGVLGISNDEINALDTTGEIIIQSCVYQPPPPENILVGSIFPYEEVPMIGSRVPLPITLVTVIRTPPPPVNISVEIPPEVPVSNVGIPPPEPLIVATPLLAPSPELSDIPHENIYYPSNRGFVTEGERKQLSANATWLLAHPDATVVIEGHTDNRGKDPYNLELSARRAQEAKDVLIKMGVDPSRIEVMSYGGSKPQCLKQTEACYQENRRSHFTVKKNGAIISPRP